MAIDQSVINFAVYEDSVEYLGMSKVTLPGRYLSDAEHFGRWCRW